MVPGLVHADVVEEDDLRQCLRATKAAASAGVPPSREIRVAYDDVRVYGPGGRELANWAMKRFELKGDKLKSETRVTGQGPVPPSVAFR